MSSCKLEQMYGHTHKYYLNNFKRYNLPIRSNKENSRKYTVNNYYFDDIDCHEKAYWLGYFFADGYVSSANGKRIGMSLALKDENQLYKLKKCLNATYPIKEYITTHGYKKGSRYSRLLIASDQLYDSLVSHGVVEQKTNILKFPNIQSQYYSSFILGYFDGDGSFNLSRGKSPFYSIYFVGTDNILTNIHNIFKYNQLIKKELYLEKRQSNQIVSYIRYGGNIEVERIMTFLYSNINLDIPLERKYNIYLKCKNRNFGRS